MGVRDHGDRGRSGERRCGKRRLGLGGGEWSGVLSKIDLDTNAVVSVVEIPAGGRTATFGFGSVWVGHDDGTVSRIDAESGALIATIDVGDATPVWIEPGADSIWLGNGTGGQAVRIDPGTNAVVARIDVGDTTGAIMENRDGVWIHDFDGAVTRIDPSTNEIVARIETADGGLTLGATADAVWAPGGPAGVVYRVDPSTNRASGQVDVSASVGSPANISGIHAVGGSVWVRFSHGCADTECTQSVGRIDPESNRGRRCRRPPAELAWLGHVRRTGHCVDLLRTRRSPASTSEPPSRVLSAWI